MKIKVPNPKIHSDSESYYKLALKKFFEAIRKEKEKTKSMMLIMHNKLITLISFVEFRLLIEKISKLSLEKKNYVT